MPMTTKAQMGKDAKAYEKAWEKGPAKFEPCQGCKSPGYCKNSGCQAKEAAKAKRLGG